ncbi:MAG: transglutaminase domain-containing protein [Clostridia bacterium]|nr:transglutaminase domain-containing protein [Clostridia bacterium]
MKQTVQTRYCKTSTYTYSGAYQQYLKSLPDDIPALGRLVCDQITHPTMYYLPPSAYLEETYFGKFDTYSSHRFKDEDELFVTAAAMLAELFRLDERGLVSGKHVNQRLTVSCRHASVLFSAILKAKGIPCRSRAGFMDFGNDGTVYTEHWINEYWKETEQRWILVDADGYYEYENRYGYSQFDLPKRKFLSAADAWLSYRQNTLSKFTLDIIAPTLASGICAYLFMDFHALMNQEIFYSHQPEFLRNGLQNLSADAWDTIDALAVLMQHPDENIEAIEHLYLHHKPFYTLTNPTQNELADAMKG